MVELSSLGCCQSWVGDVSRERSNAKPTTTATWWTSRTPAGGDVPDEVPPYFTWCPVFLHQFFRAQKAAEMSSGYVIQSTEETFSALGQIMISKMLWDSTREPANIALGFLWKPPGKFSTHSKPRFPRLDKILRDICTIKIDSLLRTVPVIFYVENAAGSWNQLSRFRFLWSPFQAIANIITVNEFIH